MVANYSSKRVADAARNAHWAGLPAAHFAALGVSHAQVATLQSGLVGAIIMKGDPGYDDARHIFNPIFDRYPGAIIKCQTEADVAQALAFAQLVPGGFAIRSGGHSTAGYSTCDGVLIDVSALQDVSVDLSTFRVTVGPGCNFGKLYQVLEGYGLHVPGGECPDVCVGGFVQGGGYGFTSVSYGMNCDNAVAFRVMLADGSIVWANPQVNADLFWALCGGTGGNFGIILNVSYALRPLGPVTGWALAWPLTSTTDIANAAAAMMELQTNYMLNSICGPDMNMQVSLCFQNWIDPTQPKPPSGTPLQPYFMARGMWLGTPSALPPLLQQLMKLPGCIQQWVETGTFRYMNEHLLNYPQGMPLLDQMPFEDKVSRYIARNLTLGEWTTLLTLFAGAPNNMAYGYGEFYGGAINQKAQLSNAFVHRDSALNMVMDVYWLLNTDRAKCEAFLDAWTTTLDPLSNGEVYQNYPSAADLDYIAHYWGPAYPVLQAVKAKYDPGNVFGFAQQIWAVPPQAAAPNLPAGLPAGVTAALAQPVTMQVVPKPVAASA